VIFPISYADSACSTEEIENYLLMVDARKTWGFKMADRRIGLDYDHCKLVMNEIAKFHALSWNYFVKKGLGKLKDKFPFVIESIFRQDQAELLNGMMGMHFQLMLQALNDSTEISPGVINGVKRFSEDPLQVMLLFLKEDGHVEEAELLKHFRVKPKPGTNIVNRKSEQ